jgi:pimeloyl-ACP methyl ester carboxylesterase
MLKDLFIQVGSVNTRYCQAGTSGSAVLLVHGIGCSVLEWQHNIEALAAKHRVYAIDLLGFGLTDKPANETYSLRRLAQFLLDFMQAKQIPRAHIAGNSLGGRLAIECAIIAPSKVLSMVLVDPAGIQVRGALFEFRLSTLPLLGELFTRPSRLGLKMLWRKAFANPSGFVTDELVATKVALANQPGAQAAFLKTLRGFLGFGGFTPALVNQLQVALPSLAMPTLVLWGKQDQFVAVEHAQVLGSMLPNVEVQIWDRCGHTPQIECAKQFNDVVLDFLRIADATSR